MNKKAKFLVMILLLVAIVPAGMYTVVEGQVVSGSIVDNIDEALKSIDVGLYKDVYKETIYPKNTFVISNNKLDIDVIPFRTSGIEDQSQVLDDFILEMHGAAEVLSQSHDSVDPDIVIRIYNLHSNYYEVFVLKSLDGTAAVFHAQIQATDLKNLLNGHQNKSLLEIVRKSDAILRDSKLNLVERQPKKILQELRDINNQLNSKLENSI